MLRSSSTAIRRGIGQRLERVGLAEPRLEQLRGIGRRSAARTLAMPGCCDRKRVTSATTLSVSARSLASTCTVTSLAMSRSQAEADWFIM